MKIRDASTEIRYSCENPLRNHGKKSHQLTIDDFTCEPNDVLWTAGSNKKYIRCCFRHLSYSDKVAVEQELKIFAWIKQAELTVCFDHFS